MLLESTIMKKSLSTIILGIAAVSSFLLAPMAYAFYDNYPTENIQFHPQNKDYYDGNLRLKLKERADIERASAPNVHYSKTDGDYYTCSWKYNPNLGTWVCNKTSTRVSVNTAQSVDVCPFGFILNPSKQCAPVNVPYNAHLNSRGDGWQCNAGYKNVGSGCILNLASNSSTRYVAVIDEPEQIQVTKYVYVYGDSDKRPTSLPSSGAGVVWTLISGAIGTLGYIAKRKLF